MNKIVRSFNNVIPLFFWILCTISYAQNPLLELSFTAVNITQYQQLDSIKIKNLTLGCDTALYYPDTTLVLDYISNILESGESIENHFFLGQNFPNPFKNETHVKLYLPVEENIVIRISDVLGRQIANYKRSLQSGLHSFTFYPAKERNYLLSVSGNYATKTIKMLAIGAGSNTACKIEYDGLEEKTKPFKSDKALYTFVFNEGDELVYIGNAGGVESAILGSPTENQLIEFQFATKIPCPRTPSITYGGQIYNTIQILSQCWLKENLNFETANSWC
nr:hypothetical protein [Bacteroidota bacterium]